MLCFLIITRTEDDDDVFFLHNTRYYSAAPSLTHLAVTCLFASYSDPEHDPVTNNPPTQLYWQSNSGSQVQSSWS